MGRTRIQRCTGTTEGISTVCRNTLRFSLCKDQSGYKLNNESWWQIQAATEGRQVSETPRNRNTRGTEERKKVQVKGDPGLFLATDSINNNQLGAHEKDTAPSPISESDFNKAPAT